MVKLIYCNRNRLSPFITNCKNIEKEEGAIPYVVFVMDEKLPSCKLQLNKVIVFSFIVLLKKRVGDRHHKKNEDNVS